MTAEELIQRIEKRIKELNDLRQQAVADQHYKTACAYRNHEDRLKSALAVIKEYLQGDG